MKSKEVCEKCGVRMELESPEVITGSIDEKHPKIFDDIEKVVPATYKCPKCGHIK